MTTDPPKVPVTDGYAGLLLIGDPHVMATPPGHRLDDYRRTIGDKLRFCLDLARDRKALPIILGDLFHVPRDNPNALLVDLIELFRPHQPWVLVGNHDKYEARLTRDVSLAVLDAAGVIRLLDQPGPVTELAIAGRRVLLGAAPDWTEIPTAVDRNGCDWVIWVSHHNLSFPDYEAGRVKLREISGIDLVVNGHIHTPKPPQQRGRTLWLNPGSIVRISRSRITRALTPVVTLWTPAGPALESIEVPHRPFDEVFPPLAEDEGESGSAADQSLFIKGLENLSLRRSSEGIGLKSFLEDNLTQDDAVDDIIWDLYREVVERGQEK